MFKPVLFVNNSRFFWNNFSRKCSYTSKRSTIFALSSGASRSAIAVIRISGPSSIKVVEEMARIKKERITPRKAVLRRLVDPSNGEVLDNGIVLWFPQPNSFTGEDSVELHVHGGVAVISSVINALQKFPGFRIAEAGEFTKRAYLAGKLDATEVEGLADLLRAETETQRRQAIRQATGGLAALYNSWRTSILACMAHLEAFVDFGEDQDIGDEVLSSLQSSIQDLKSQIDSHLNDNRRGERLRSGVQVAIIGEPNVGKSSLINILSRRNVAIVSPYAGTTRDILEVSLDIGGFPIVLCDTAGLRDSIDPVENEGLRRAKGVASTADLVILVIDASSRESEILSPERTLEDLVRMECKRLDVSFDPDCSFIVLLNKLDLISSSKKLQTTPGLCAISCKTEEGLKDFLSTLQSQLAKLCANPVAEAPLITSSRQRHHVQVASNHLQQFLETVQDQGDLALAGEHLRRSSKQIGCITARGKIDTEEMLDVLFQSFCIGK